MESAPETRPFRALTDAERNIIEEFSVKGLEEFKRETPARIIGTVLQKLMNNMTTDMGLRTGAEDSALVFCDDGSSPPIVLEMPRSPTQQDYVKNAQALDQDFRIGGDRTGLVGHAKHCLFDYLPLVYRMIQERYGLEENLILNRLRSQLRDSGFGSELVENDDGSLVVEGELVAGKDKLSVLTAALGSSVGVAGVRRISKHKFQSFERILDGCMRIFLRSEEARSQLLLLLSNQGRAMQAGLADSIVRQGNRTLLRMEGMTMRDQYAAWLSSFKIIGNRAEKEAKSKKKSVDAQSPSFLPYLSESDQQIWHKADVFLKENTSEQRERILAMLKPEETRKYMSELRELCQWDALAAYERSVLGRIYAEVTRFPYGTEDIDKNEAHRHAHLAGTPKYAIEQRRLNCFTTEWLTTALAIECGIPYGQIAYCHANHYGTHQASVHGQLLFCLSDGTFVIIDQALGKCLQSFPLDVVEDPRERKHLEQFFNCRSPSEAKGMYEAIPVHIHHEDAERMNLCQDLLVTTPDQAFAAGSLLNVGIVFERQGNRDEALCAYELGLSIEPEHPDLLCRVGMHWSSIGDNDRAERYFRAALKSNSHHPHARYYLALDLWEQGRLGAAAIELMHLWHEERDVWGDPDFQSRVADAQVGILRALEDSISSKRSGQSKT